MFQKNYLGINDKKVTKPEVYDMEITKAEKDISSYIGRMLRETFGRGPSHVICTLSSPTLAVHLADFLSPMEKSLLANQDGEVYVQKNRDLLMETIIKDITSYIEAALGTKVDEFFYDWNLQTSTGMFIITLSKTATSISDYRNREKVERELAKVTKLAQKEPVEIYSTMLNKRQLMIVRKGIMVPIEKELIKFGFTEQLTIAKRDLEKRLIIEHKRNFENYLNTKIIDKFTFWNFEKDTSYIIFILQS